MLENPRCQRPTSVTSWQSSDRYGGVRPCRDLYTGTSRVRCGVASHSTEHLFLCPACPTLTAQDLWNKPDMMADFLNPNDVWWEEQLLVYHNNNLYTSTTSLKLLLCLTGKPNLQTVNRCIQTILMTLDRPPAGVAELAVDRQRWDCTEARCTDISCTANKQLPVNLTRKQLTKNTATHRK